jgi:hypothetical protein
LGAIPPIGSLAGAYTEILLFGVFVVKVERAQTPIIATQLAFTAKVIYGFLLELIASLGAILCSFSLSFNLT